MFLVVESSGGLLTHPDRMTVAERIDGQFADTPANPKPGGSRLPPTGRNGVLSLARLLARQAVTEHTNETSVDG